MTINEEILFRRVQKNVTQGMIANKIGIDRGFIIRAEKGNYDGFPSISKKALPKMIKLLRFLGFNIKNFYTNK